MREESAIGCKVVSLGDVCFSNSRPLVYHLGGSFQPRLCQKTELQKWVEIPFCILIGIRPDVEIKRNPRAYVMRKCFAVPLASNSPTFSHILSRLQSVRISENRLLSGRFREKETSETSGQQGSRLAVDLLTISGKESLVRDASKRVAPGIERI